MTDKELLVSFFYSHEAAAQYGRREAILEDGRTIQYTIEKMTHIFIKENCQCQHYLLS